MLWNSCELKHDSNRACTRPEGAYKIFDINIRQHFFERTLRLLRACNVLKLMTRNWFYFKELFSKQQSNESDVCKWFVKSTT